MHTISAPSGQVQRIVIFKKNGVQAMVEYPFAIPFALIHSCGSRSACEAHTSFTKRVMYGRLELERISLTWNTCFLLPLRSLLLFLLFLRETATRWRSLSVTRHRYNAMKIYKRNQRVTRLQDLPAVVSLALILALIPWPEYRHGSWHTG